MDKFNLDRCLKAVAKGDEQALKNLYHNYKNPMFQFALSIVKDYDLAEEAVQDTFVNIISYSKNSRIDTI